MFPCRAFVFLVFLTNVYWSAIVPQNSPCPEKLLLAHLHSRIILFAKRSILNAWQCSEYFSVSITIQQFVPWPNAMFCIIHIQNSGLWICISLKKYSWTCRVTWRYVLYGTFAEPCLLLWIQTYSGVSISYSDIFSHTVVYLEPFVTLAYS